MRKIIFVCLCSLLLTGCSGRKDLADYEKHYAIIDGVGEVPVDDVYNYSSGVVQIWSTDGTLYITHYSNVILVGRDE